MSVLKLKETYAKNLLIAQSRYSSDYAWPISEMPKVIERMNLAIDKMSFNKDSPAWKMTCKELGIKHTYQAIKGFKEE